MTTRRLFFGLPLGEGATRMLEAALPAVRAQVSERQTRVRWTQPANWHCTLKFLGDLEMDHVERLVEAARRLNLPDEPDVTWQGLGAFPSLTRARVLVAHLSDPAGRLVDLAAVLDDWAAARGVPREARPFRPHVTLARLPRPLPLHHIEQTPLVGPAPLGPVTLLESRRSPEGSAYVPLWQRSPQG